MYEPDRRMNEPDPTAIQRMETLVQTETQTFPSSYISIPQNTFTPTANTAQILADLASLAPGDGGCGPIGLPGPCDG